MAKEPRPPNPQAGSIAGGGTTGDPPPIRGTPASPQVDPKSVTTAGQVLSQDQGGGTTGTGVGSVNPSPGMNATWGPIPVMNDGLTFREVGQTGLRQFSGWVREEFLQVLTGRQGAQKYREMMDNNSSVGGMLFAIQSAMKKVEWRVQPDETGMGNKASQEDCDFLESCLYDMSSPWDTVVGEILSMLPFGFHLSEIVYKRRNGRDPGPDPQRRWDDLPSSEYDDGKIGWRRLPGRSQDTIIKWFFDENGVVKGATQQPWVGPLIDIPIEKALLFRPIHYKSNPEGRALDPETLLPTPKGWQRLDDVQLGDQVFDEAGRPCNVVGRADWFDRRAYRVTFSDGCEIIADENHEWLVQNMYERGHTYEGKKTFATRRTTKEISKRFMTRFKQPVYSIPWAAPLQYPRQDLPLDPYIFGLWLGDGSKDHASIACHESDAAHLVEAVQAAGFSGKIRHNGRRGELGRWVSFASRTGGNADLGTKGILRRIGVLHNKHVPDIYLRSSVEQRLALLRGLMDTDGSVSEVGQCSFCNINYGLIQAVAELLRSLGCGKLDVRRLCVTKAGNQAWVVVFSPPFVPFSMQRKASRCKQRERRQNHYIANVEPIEIERTTCIEVDSKSHLFLAGTSCIPTSNSIIRNAYVSYYYSKRLQEQQAIFYERMGGVPLIKIPAQILEAAAGGDAAALASVNAYKNIVRNLRTDEQMGVLLPSDTWPNAQGAMGGAEMYKFELVTPGAVGRGGLNYDVTIQRLNVQMLTSVLADFLTLGHEARGTQSLAVTKVDMFFQAVEGYLNSIAGVFNRYGTPRLWALNGWDYATMPKIEPDLAQRVDLDVLSNFVLRLAQAGMPLFPDEDLQSYIKDAAGLPDVDDSAALQAAGLLPEQLDQKDEVKATQLDQMQNPDKYQVTKPAPGSARDNLEKMIKKALAQRYIRHSGPRHGIVTKTGRRLSGRAQRRLKNRVPLDGRAVG